MLAPGETEIGVTSHSREVRACEKAPTRPGRSVARNSAKKGVCEQLRVVHNETEIGVTAR